MTFELANVDRGVVKVNMIPATVIVAMIGLATTGFELLADKIFKSPAQKASIELELEKFDLERDREAISLFRQALSNPDSAERKRMVDFIVATKLLSSDIDTVELRSLKEFPQWPVELEESPE